MQSIDRYTITFIPMENMQFLKAMADIKLSVVRASISDGIDHRTITIFYYMARISK